MYSTPLELFQICVVSETGTEIDFMGIFTMIYTIYLRNILLSHKWSIDK